MTDMCNHGAFFFSYRYCSEKKLLCDRFHKSNQKSRHNKLLKINKTELTQNNINKSKYGFHLNFVIQ